MPMAVGDDMMEGSNFSTILDTTWPKQSGDVLSGEDLAWPDSYLIKDPEMSESNWDSLKDALLDIISHQTDSLDSSALERDGSSEGYDMMEGSNSSTILYTMGPKQSGDVLSVEDLAWADSCLIKDPAMSETDWDSLKDSLLDIISHQPVSLDSSALERDGSSEGNDIEILPSFEETKTTQNLERTVDDDVQINEATEKNNDDHAIEEKNVTSWSTTNLQNAFLPTYKGERIEIVNSDSDVDSVFPTFVTIEPSTEDIFKVWDLDIPAEEDELIKQLDKALSESSLQPTPSTFDDSEVWKGLKEETVDDLVAGIADLSLNQNSG